MQDGGLPPSGWYPDPENPGQLRFWDGTQWTAHRRPDGPALPRPPGAARGTGLSNLTDWLSDSFRVTRARVQPALAITLILGIPAQIAVLFTFIWFVRPWKINAACEFSGFSTSRFVLLLVVVALAAAANGLSSVAVARQMHTGHEGLDEPWTASIGHAISRLGRLIVAYLIVFLVVAAGLVVLGLLTWATGGIALLLLIPLVPLFIWAALWLAFLPMAAAAAPAGTRLLPTCRNLTRNRWWALLGRVLVLGIILLIVNTAFGLVTSPLSPSTGVTEALNVDFDETDDCPVIDMSTTASNSASLIIALLVTSIVRGLVGLPMQAGIAGLYLEAGGPTDSPTRRPQDEDEHRK